MRGNQVVAGETFVEHFDHSAVEPLDVADRDGVAGGAHRNPANHSTRYAWPSARWGSLPLEGGIEAAYRAQIDAANDPDEELRNIEDRLNKLRSPFRTAESFWIEEIIDPRNTRSLLCEFVNLAAPLRKPGKYSHGIRP